MSDAKSNVKSAIDKTAAAAKNATDKVSTAAGNAVQKSR